MEQVQITPLTKSQKPTTPALMLITPLTKSQKPTTPAPMLIIPLGKALLASARQDSAAARKAKMESSSSPHVPSVE